MTVWSNKSKVIACIIGNYITAALVTIVVIIFRDPKGSYFRFGPSNDLLVISILINTWGKWVLTIAFIGVIKGCEVLVNELGSPILGFRVYNPDCKVITDFTKNELNFLANAMWFVNNFRSILMTVVSITQIDLALAGMVISELVSIGTVRILLNEKKFIKNNNNTLVNSDGEEHDINEENGDDSINLESTTKTLIVKVM
jgi:hypothetical protein